MTFVQVVSDHWEGQYNFALRMCLDKARARKVVEETFLRAYIGSESMPVGPKIAHWLYKISHHILNPLLGRTPEVTFDMLDETLRSDATRTDVVRSLAEPRRDFLLWELKQGCMTSVVNCLSPGERAAFVLSTVLKLEDKDGAVVLGVKRAAYKVRLSRARKKISDYLAPRCEHVDPMNPCRCPARIGVALNKGFIKSGGELNLRKPLPSYGRYGTGAEEEDVPLRDIVVIYGNLPTPTAPDDLYEHILQQLSNGSWEKISQHSKS